MKVPLGLLRISAKPSEAAAERKSRASGLLRQAVEDHDVHPAVRIGHLLQDQIGRDAVDLDIDLARDVGIGRHQIVLPSSCSPWPA